MSINIARVHSRWNGCLQEERGFAMKCWSLWIGSLAIALVATLPAAAQGPVLSTIAAPYAPVQSQVQMAGNTYGPGTVAYGPVGTPVVLSGSGLGDNGDVWFFAYKNGALDIKTAPALGVVTLWTASQIFVKIPSGAVSGLVQVVVRLKCDGNAK